jgi:hypothetical protein
MMRRRYQMLPQRQREAVLHHCAIRDSLMAGDGELAEYLSRHVKGAREAFEMAVKCSETDKSARN